MVNEVTTYASTQQPVSAVPAKVANKPEVKAVNEVENTRQALPENGKNAPESKPGAELSLTEAVEQMQDFAKSNGRDLNFSVDEDSGRTVVTVTDSVTEEVVRQIPSEEALRIAKAIEDGAGFLVEAEA